MQNILAQACQNETNEAAKRQRVDSTSNNSDVTSYTSKINQNSSITAINHNPHHHNYRVHPTPPQAPILPTANDRIPAQAQPIDDDNNRRGNYKVPISKKGTFCLLLYFEIDIFVEGLHIPTTTGGFKLLNLFCLLCTEK